MGANFPLQAPKKGITNTIKIDLALVVFTQDKHFLQIPTDYFQEFKLALQCLENVSFTISKRVTRFTVLQFFYIFILKTGQSDAGKN